MSSCPGTTWGTRIPPSLVSASVTRCSAPSRAARRRQDDEGRCRPPRGCRRRRPDRATSWASGSAPQDEPLGDERPVEAVRGLLPLGHQHPGRVLRQLAGTRHVWRRSPQRTQHDGRRAQRRVVAAPLRDRPRGPDPRGLPAVGRRELVQPRDDDVDAGSVECESGCRVCWTGRRSSRTRSRSATRRANVSAMPAGELCSPTVRSRVSRISEQHMGEPADAAVHAVGVVARLRLVGALRQPQPVVARAAPGSAPTPMPARRGCGTHPRREARAIDPGTIPARRGQQALDQIRPLASGGTSTACSSSTDSGMTSSARAFVDASTTGAATPSW